MPPIGQHFNFRLVLDRVIAPTAAQRLAVAQAVFSAARPFRLLNFNLPDTHFHGVCIEELDRARELVRRIKLSLGRRLGLEVGFASTWFEPIDRQAHLTRAFWYTFDQHQRHGLPPDPAWIASNLPDLVGMRVLGRYTQRTVAGYLPRVRRCELLGRMGLDGLQEADGPVELIPTAVRDAAGLHRLDGRTKAQLVARRAALAVAAPNLGSLGLARLFDQNRRTIGRLVERYPVADPNLVRALRLQLGARKLRCEPMDPSRLHAQTAD